LAKFRRNVNKNVNINGYTDNYNIAEEFSKHFEKVHYSSTNNCCAVNNHFLRSREEQIANSDMLNHNVVNSITVELIDKCMRSMKKGQSLWPGQSMYGTPSICTPITTTALKATI